MTLDTGARVAAVRSRDARFDGVFVLGVRSTGIYCRPSCPARPPKESNMAFYPSAAAAQVDGYRACKRCRPDASPGSPLWHERSDLVARVMRLIADGVVDRDGVAGLARTLGYSGRQIERLVAAELGAGPLALARAQRAHTARILIETTAMPMADVAFAAGFSSVRSFNDTVRSVFAAVPSALRGQAARAGRGRSEPPGALVPALGLPATHRIALRLPYRGPLHADSLFGHLAATAVPGMEAWVDDGFARSVRLDHGPAVVHVRPAPEHVAATMWLSDLRDLTAVMQRCRRMLDLDADPVAVDAHLAQDPDLAALVRARPGARIPGCLDPAEMTLRVLLSQHISTRAAATLTSRLVESVGEALPVPQRGEPRSSSCVAITRLFPDPSVIATCDPGLLPGMPPTRLRTLRTVSAALADGSVCVSPGADRDELRARLLRIPGVGPWTAEMVALRGLGDPDAFPATDLGVRRTAAAHGLPQRHAELVRRSARWRPWRGYVTQMLWAASSHAAARMPGPAPGEQAPR